MGLTSVRGSANRLVALVLYDTGSRGLFGGGGFGFAPTHGWFPANRFIRDGFVCEGAPRDGFGFSNRSIFALFFWGMCGHFRSVPLSK